jgi:hypothetical protein
MEPALMARFHPCFARIQFVDQTGSAQARSQP